MTWTTRHARRTVGAVVLATSLALAGCGGDDTTTDPPSETDAATSSPSEASPSESMSESMSEPESTGVDTAALTGSYAGSWTNTTFGSTGATTVDVAFPEDGVVEVTIDLDGGVFGENDPDAFTFGGSFADDGATIDATSDLLGDFTFTIGADGSFRIDAPDVPSTRIASMTVSGTFTQTGGQGTYEVAFPDGGGSAEGTFTITRG